MANLLHIKGSRTQVLNSFPTRSFGKDGDIVLCRINGKGVYLCSKAAGSWYAANKLQQLSRVEKTSIRDLSVSSLSINKMINSPDNTNKLIVNNNGKIQYRTNLEVINDLDIFQTSNINYKTAHCSLGQYTDKESCEAGGGTWYYSENDSHDSVSSTAENQLLTVGESIGNLDAEPTLLYDGSTLEIKYNSDYDDNWQTSAQTSLLKLSYDASDYLSFTVAANGASTIATNDNDGGAGHLTLDADGSINLDSNGGSVNFYLAGDTDDFCRLTVEANGKTTIATADSDGTAGHLTLDADGDIELNADGGDITFKDDAVTMGWLTKNGVTSNKFALNSIIGTGNYSQIETGGSGVTTISTVDSDGTVGHLTMQPDGDLILDPVSQKTIINATDYLYFDGGTHTSIHETADDVLRIAVGGDTIIQFSEKGDDGNEVHFGSSCAGFTQLEPTYDATNTVVDFRHSNKQNLTFGAGSITNVQFYFPLVSGNFVLLVKQDGTGSRTITNYRAYEFDESTADGVSSVVWAGGSNPTLTTDANHVDILSFYWDADNEIAYGVATLDFQF
tara:strand:+ start:8159 stop:9841 length:1683 start_codon:yes stop_codon:yes gene_type:complete